MNKKILEIIDQKFNDLFKKAEDIVNQYGLEKNRSALSKSPDLVEYNSFRSELRNLIEKVAGENSTYYKEFIEVPSRYSCWKSEVAEVFFLIYYGILKGLFSDFKAGLLVKIKYLIRAELISDYLEQAIYLNENGFHCASASVAGAVLEDALRKICDKNAIHYEEQTKINSLNVLLAKSGVYDATTQKIITVYAGLRNDADHGHFDKVKKDYVEGMVNGVLKFVNEYLS